MRERDDNKNWMIICRGNMWHLLPILYLASVQGHHHRHRSSPYPAAVLYNNERPRMAPYSFYPGQTGVQAPAPYYNVPSKQYPDYSNPPPFYNYPPQRQAQYGEDVSLPPLYKIQGSMYYSNLNANNLRQSQNQPKSNLNPETFPFDLDYSNNDLELDVEPKGFLEGQSYFEELELIENFGNYLKRRTQLDGSSTTLTDAAHQYNALLAVIIALARVVRSSCADFDVVYDQVYLSTVDTYFKYGLANADKVAGMIEDYIRKGNSHMPKLKKLKQELCTTELFCSVSVDSKIKTSPLLYVKELETLEALSHLARSFYPYIEEFNQAAQKGTVLQYLQNSKDRLREYVMHVVNSVEHLSDKVIKCT